MNYVINHERMLQQLEAAGETRAFQIDRALNPADVLASWWRDAQTRARHYALLMGDPSKARRMWRESAAFKQWRPAKIVPVPVAPPNVTPPTGVKDDASFPSESEA